MKKILLRLLVALMVLPAMVVEAQSPATITGTVYEAVSGDPLIGVSVVLVGTTTGTTTDIDGNFTINAPVGGVLKFTYVGHAPQEVTIVGTDPLAVYLDDNIETLDEVVVTALGIKRDQKSLSYNVQKIDGDMLTTNKNANFINSLSGKVAGVTINASSAGPGSISKVQMRGTKSIMQSSNALYVIDGMPMRAPRSTGGAGAFDSSGATEPVADLNPEDIETMSVLNGAAAAALYGSDAANGAIVITTKKGMQGKTNVTYSNNTEFNRAWMLPQFQNSYGAGQNGVLNVNSPYSWGAPLTPYNNYGYDIAKDFLQTGYVETNALTFSTGNKKNQTYASVAAVNSKGIVPNNKYDRYNFSIRNTSSFLNDKMTLDLSAQYIRQTDRNLVNQGTYMNPIVGAYLFPRGNDWSEVCDYEVYDPARNISVQNWRYGEYNLTVQNPYWVSYRNLRENAKDRYMMGGTLSYKVLPYLTLQGRVRMDNSNTKSTDKRYASTINTLSDNSNSGYYGESDFKEREVFADFLVTFNKDLNENWNLMANFGGSIEDSRYDAVTVNGGIADGSDNFPGQNPGLTNFFSITNINQTPTKTWDMWHEQNQSLYASVDLGLKSTYYLTLTGRNEWPSALRGPRSNKKSFFYPSVGLSVLMNQLMENAGVYINQQYFSFWKIRASYARVGSAFERYIANPRYEWSNGSWSIQTQYPIDNLKPEMTTSWEVGMNFRFLQDLTFDVTWYSANTANQTFNPGIAAGQYSKIYIQTGNIRNTGMEFALGYNHQWGNFQWVTGLTYSYNRNRILDLFSNAYNPITGEKITNDQLVMTDTQVGATRFILREGGSMGDLYSMVDIVRDSNGNMYIDTNGNLQTYSVADKPIKLGSVLPKGNLAWSNTLRWKNLSLNFMFAARFGGIVYSRTQAVLDQWGVSKATGVARDLGYVMLNNGDKVNPEQWYTTISEGETVPQFYTYDATNVRLQDLTLSYLFPRKMLGNVCDIRVSLVAKNLWMIYCKAPYDPEAVASAGNYFQGIDNFMTPSLRTIGFNINFNF